jgi:hypothetical protein
MYLDKKGKDRNEKYYRKHNFKNGFKAICYTKAILFYRIVRKEITYQIEKNRETLGPRK